ncbi:hypothetical protein F5Y16DRAFT_396120 [Xylariaceae sp. FL0255]|nr:hypothetical protein F5Y16DRAFT_396120 [Xylariaceae sp. FL0255]
MTFLDRVTVGKARLWRLTKDLGLKDYDYNIDRFCLLGLLVRPCQVLFALRPLRLQLHYPGSYSPQSLEWSHLLPRNLLCRHWYIHCAADAIAWIANQIPSQAKRGTLSGYAVSVTQIGGIISAVVSPSKTSPQYLPGPLTSLTFQIIGTVATLAIVVVCGHENHQGGQGGRDSLRELPQEEQDQLGEHHPDFRSTL